MKKVSAKELNGMLHAGEVRFRYMKKDGTVRDARGTLRGDLITVKSKGGRNVVKDYGYNVYFDLDKDAFRCFDPDMIAGVAEE